MTPENLDFSDLREGKDMSYKITADSRNILRVADDEGSYISLNIVDDTAYILSMMVPDDRRRQRIGTALLHAAEDVLSARGVTHIAAVYLDSIEGMGEFLRSNAFEVEEGPAIIDIKNALTQDHTALDKWMKYKVDNVKVSLLRDLDISKWDEMYQFLTDRGVNLTCFDLACLNQEISAVIYDTKDSICSMILGSVRDNVLYLEFLYTKSGKGDEYYTLAALQSMIQAVMTPQGETIYDRVLMVACNPGIKAIIGLIRLAGEKPDQIGRCLSARKKIVPHPVTDRVEVINDIEEGSKLECIRELADDPIQHIISWKVPWYRMHISRR